MIHARQLGISVPMVKEHVNATFAKLGTANRAEAVGIALRKHLLKYSATNDRQTPTQRSPRRHCSQGGSRRQRAS